MMAAGSSRSRSGRDGFIVVAVLWIVAALAALVSIYAIYVSNSAAAVAASSDGLIADPLASAGVELATYRLLGAQGSARPTTGEFTARIGAARLVIAFQTEAARIDLNKAPKELLSGLFLSIGAEPKDADGYAERIIAWRTAAAAQNRSTMDTDSENSLYRSAGLSYVPRHAPFVHLGELWLVYGIPPALTQRILPYVTVYSGQAQVDLAAAAPQVIAALQNASPNSMPGQPGALAQQSPDNFGGRGADSGEAGQGTAERPTNSVFRIGVRVEFDNGRRSAAEAVILISNGGAVPYHVLSWHNALDGTADQPMDFGRR
jgi:general secretion pathway protein K